MMIEGLLGAIQQGIESKFWIDAHSVADMCRIAVFTELYSVFHREKWATSLKHNFFRRGVVSDDVGHRVRKPTST